MSMAETLPAKAGEFLAGECTKLVSSHKVREGLDKDENTKDMMRLRKTVSWNMLEHNLGNDRIVLALLLHTSPHLAAQTKAVLASISIFKGLQKAVSWFITCVVMSEWFPMEILICRMLKNPYITSFYLMQEPQETRWINQAATVYGEALVSTVLFRQPNSSSCRSSKQNVDKEDSPHEAE